MGPAEQAPRAPEQTAGAVCGAEVKGDLRHGVGG